MKKPKILVICGPTATGKSDLAVELAIERNGEIISADSRQVYKGLDIGSGKITKKEMKGIPHYLLDVISPKKVFSVNNYQRLATEKIEDILSRGKLPIICGGTGFYIESIVDGIVLPEVKPNKELRKKLEKESVENLFKKLKKLDGKRAREIDKNNKVRLIRAIEIAEELGKVPKVKKIQKYDTEIIGLDTDDENLKYRINKRLIKRLPGIIREIKKLKEDGLSWKRLESFGLEYRYGALYLQNKISRKEMIEKLNIEIWHYAKRQITWFKRDKRIEWRRI